MLVGKAFGQRPSDILDPECEHLRGLDRVLFDGALLADETQWEKMKSGEFDGASVADRTEFEESQVDAREYNELEKLKEKMRQDA